ncbi:putative branched-subunit amino acid permease [Paucimonas lemoignei]|uniref:Putative branched-subunit amino acid permease n=2 Tax=Paucimonas lemoignei TaxID=29443 RepID=A0A4R3HT38_PAULE|nr:putative branched-subunit amino acid permease [Paucimonas lemoignei]
MRRIFALIGFTCRAQQLEGMGKLTIGLPDHLVPAAERESFRQAVADSAPAMAGIFAWGMVTAMAMLKAGLTAGQALGMTFIVFAGSAQLACLPLIIANASVWIVFATALVVNLRFVIFSASMGPHLSHLPWYKRLWHGYLNGDLTMALFSQRFPPHTQPERRGKEGYAAGVNYMNWCAWQIGSVLGIVLASQIPQSWGIAFAGTLALLAVLIPLTMNAAALAGVVVAAALAVLTVHWPYRLGLLAALIAGMVAAMAVDKLIGRREKKEQT